jgi:hypothetical protein
MQIIIRSTSLKKFKSKFVVFEAQEKRQMCRSECDEQCTFSMFKILLDLSFFCSPEYTNFELRFCRIVDLKIIDFLRSILLFVSMDVFRHILELDISIPMKSNMGRRGYIQNFCFELLENLDTVFIFFEEPISPELKSHLWFLEAGSLY